MMTLEVVVMLAQKSRKHSGFSWEIEEQFLEWLKGKDYDIEEKRKYETLYPAAAVWSFLAFPIE